jgi:hypothetical protein
MHTIEFDRSMGIIRIKTMGFWTVEEAGCYWRELKDHVEAARRSRGRALTLIDARESKVQSPQVIERLSGIQALVVHLPADRVAHVPNSTLLQMQVRRMITSPQARAFLSLEDAEAWLLAAN